MNLSEPTQSVGADRVQDIEDAADHRTVEETEEEAAKNTIKEGILPYPYRETMLQRAFGLGAGAFLNHLVFWSGLGHGIEGDKEWVYKTLEDWDRERALSRNQVDKARAKLKDAGVLEERRYLGNRIYYRIRWGALAAVLGVTQHLPHEGQARSPPLAQSGSPTEGQPSLLDGERSLTEITQPITQEKLRQGGYGGENGTASAGGTWEHPLPEAKASGGGGPLFPKGSTAFFPEDGALLPEQPPGPSKLSSAEVARVCDLLLKGNSVPRRLALAHLWYEQTSEGAAITVEQVAEAVCRMLNEGSDEAADRYVAPVRDVLSELRRDLLPSDGPE